VLFASLVAGAVILSFACCRLPERKAGGIHQFSAALLGGVLGGLVLLVAGYALLGVGSGSSAPALARPSAPVASGEEGSAWIQRLRGSLTSEVMARGADTLDRWVEVPAWLETRRKDLDRALRVDSTDERRPRER
jgi:hypothetical protein